jgi:dipeptidase
MRQWRVFSLLAPSLNLPDPYEQLDLTDPDGGPYRYPFSVKPDKLLTHEDIWKITRDQLQGTRFDQTKGPLAGPFGCPTRTIGGNFTTEDGQMIRGIRCVYSNTRTFDELVQARDWLPDHIGGILWWASGRPNTSVHVPFYCGATEIPEPYSTGNRFELEWGKTAFWASTVINTLANSLYNHIIEDVKEKQSEIESDTLNVIPAIDARALELYEEDPDKAREFLTSFCTSNSMNVHNQWWDLAESLLEKYAGRLIMKPKANQKPEISDEEYWLDLALEYQTEVRGISQEDIEKALSAQ